MMRRDGPCIAYLLCLLNVNLVRKNRHNLVNFDLVCESIDGYLGCRNGLKWARQATSSSAFSEWFGKEIHPGTDISVRVVLSVDQTLHRLAAWGYWMSLQDG